MPGQPSDGDTTPPVLLRGAHGDRVLPALGQSQRSTLGAMLASGKIGSAEMVAANRWYDAFAMAEYGAFDANKAGSGHGVKLFAQERQLAATTQYRLARAATGRAGDRRMRAILSEGMTMRDLALQQGVDRAFLSGKVAADLERLVEHYTGTDATQGHARES